jgi:hypothetical protein
MNMNTSLPLFVITTLFLITSLDVSAGVRYRTFTGQLEIDVSHKEGLLGYVVKQTHRNGVIEANPAFGKSCPTQNTTVLTPASAHLHAHWVVVATCGGESFMYHLSNTSGSWQDASESPYTPPEYEEDDYSFSAHINQLTLLAAIAAFASVLSLLLLVFNRRKNSPK